MVETDGGMILWGFLCGALTAAGVAEGEWPVTVLGLGLLVYGLWARGRARVREREGMRGDG